MIIKIRVGECNVLDDITISFDAKILYFIIRFYIDQELEDITGDLLIHSCKSTDEKFNSTWRELVTSGYMIKVPTKNEYELLVNSTI